MKKNLLIISNSYPPSNVPAAQRPYAVAKYLNKNNYDVTVITCGNPDTTWGVNEGFNPELPLVELIKVNSLLGKSVTGLRKNKTDTIQSEKSLKSKMKASLVKFLSSLIVPDKAIFWYPKVCWYLIKNKDLINQTDIVFTTSPSFSNHLIGKFIKSKKKSIKWISELRDFHFIEHTDKIRNLKQWINKKLEVSMIKNTDKVSFISHSMKHRYAKHFPKYRKKFRVIYNGFDVSDFENLNIANTQNEKMTLFYAGSFYRGVRSPFPLFKILDSLLEKKIITTEDIEIRIAGNFDDELIDELKKFKSFALINFIGNIPRAKVLENIVSSDLLWLIVANIATHYTGVPIKFFEYLGARRPIINFAPDDSEPTKIISENKLGWNFDTTNFDLNKSVETFKEIISKYKAGDLSKPLQYKFYPQFDRVSQGVVFEKLFEENI